VKSDSVLYKSCYRHGEYISSNVKGEYSNGKKSGSWFFKKDGAIRMAISYDSLPSYSDTIDLSLKSKQIVNTLLQNGYWVNYGGHNFYDRLTYIKIDMDIEEFSSDTANKMFNVLYFESGKVTESGKQYLIGQDGTFNYSLSKKENNTYIGIQGKMTDDNTEIYLLRHYYNNSLQLIVDK
jgi:hypothetical protein